MKRIQRSRIDLADQLKQAASDVPAPRDDALVSRVMHAVRSRSMPSVDCDVAPPRYRSWLPMAAATAAVVVVAVVVSSIDFQPTAPTPPDPLPVRLGQDLDPLLASTEHDLDREMSAVRADLDRLSRMMTIRLESDTE